MNQSICKIFVCFEYICHVLGVMFIGFKNRDSLFACCDIITSKTIFRKNSAIMLIVFCCIFFCYL